MHRKTQIIAFTLFALCSTGLVWGQDKYAVLIGVESYDPSVLGRLEYAEDDAMELGNSLKDLGFKTKVMTGQSRVSTGKPTSPGKILTVLKTQMNNCAEGDTMVISLSGHGLQCAADDPDKNGVRETYFCPEDADPNDKSSLLPISDVVELLRQCKASRKLMLIDACRNEFALTSGQKKAAKKLQLTSVHETKRQIPGGISVLFSCNQDQFSFEDENLKHSVFSYFLIKYLRGNAGARYYESEKISLDDMILFVRKKTNEYVSDNNLSASGQTPVYAGVGASWNLGKGISPVKQVLNKHLEWLGGTEKLRSIKTIKSENRFTISANGQTFASTQKLFMKGDKTLTHNIVNGTIESAYADRKVGWEHSGGKFKQYTEKEREINWINVHPYAVLDLLDQPDKLKFIGKEFKNGQEASVIMYGDEPSNMIKWYFASDGGIIAVKWSSAGATADILISEPKLFSGFKSPTRFTGTMSNQFIGQVNVNVRKISHEINAPIDDNIFNAPQGNTVQRKRFDIDQIVADYNSYSQELTAQHGGYVTNVNFRKVNSNTMAADIWLNQQFNRSFNPAETQALAQTFKQQYLNGILDEDDKNMIRSGVNFQANYLTPAGATAVKFMITSSDLR